MGKKLFVLDTNVILHDYNCIHSFQDNDIAIPISVLEEIDNFKRGQDQIHYNAREFIRILDSLSGDKLVKNGVSLGPGKGKIKIVTNHQHEAEVGKIFTEDKIDNRILSVAYYLTNNLKKIIVVLVSKDVNLRLKAKSLGLRAQDYFTDRIKDIEKLYSGKRKIENFDGMLIDKLYEPDGFLEPSGTDLKDLYPNEYLILKNQQKSALAVYHFNEQLIRRVEKKSSYGITPRNAEQTFAFNALIDPNILLVTLSGKAGTGKTLIALAAAPSNTTSTSHVLIRRVSVITATPKC